MQNFAGKRIGILGNNSYKYPHLLIKFIKNLSPSSTVISADIGSVDKTAEKMAREKGIQTLVLKSRRKNKTEEVLRNKDILLNSDAIVYFMSKEDRRIRKMIDLAKWYGKPIYDGEI